mgnify:CR=1 FL=1
MTSWCCCKNMTTKQLFAFLLSLTFGVWLLYIGAAKWCPSIVGVSNFIGYVTSDFEKTWLPGFLVVLTAWVILIAEPVLGLLLIISRGRCRLTWLLTAALMFILLLGQTIKGEHATVANIWQYLVLCIIGACCAEKACLFSKDSCCDKSSEKTSSGCCSGEGKSDSCCSK